MLNHKKPKHNDRVVYSNKLAQQELGIDFNPAEKPLHDFES